MAIIERKGGLLTVLEVDNLKGSAVFEKVRIGRFEVQGTKKVLLHEMTICLITDILEVYRLGLVMKVIEVLEM